MNHVHVQIKTCGSKEKGGRDEREKKGKNGLSTEKSLENKECKGMDEEGMGIVCL